MGKSSPMPAGASTPYEARFSPFLALFFDRDQPKKLEKMSGTLKNLEFFKFFPTFFAGLGHKKVPKMTKNGARKALMPCQAL